MSGNDAILDAVRLVTKIKLYLDETAPIESDGLGDEIADELWPMEFARPLGNAVLAAATDHFGAFDLGYCIAASRQRRGLGWQEPASFRIDPATALCLVGHWSSADAHRAANAAQLESASEARVVMDPVERIPVLFEELPAATRERLELRWAVGDTKDQQPADDPGV